MHTRRFESAIVCGDTNEDIFRGSFGVLDDHIEISIFGEDASIEQLKFGILFRTAPVFLDQLSIGVSALRIFVKEFHVGVRGCAVKVEVILLYIFAMVSFVARQTEQPLLENGIGLVPKSETETNELVAVTDRGKTIFVPAIGARTSVIVRKIFPCLSGRAVVLANRSPRAIADVGAPALPMCFVCTCFIESFFFGIHSCSPRFDCFRAINFWSRAPSSLVCLRIFSSHSRAGWESSIA